MVVATAIEHYHVRPVEYEVLDLGLVRGDIEVDVEQIAQEVCSERKMYVSKSGLGNLDHGLKLSTSDLLSPLITASSPPQPQLSTCSSIVLATSLSKRDFGAIDVTRNT